MIKIIFKGKWRESCERTKDRLIHAYIKSRTKSVVKLVKITSTNEGGILLRGEVVTE